jgi:hypothetical protein
VELLGHLAPESVGIVDGPLVHLLILLEVGDVRLLGERR